jgi:hypothetical protein
VLDQAPIYHIKGAIGGKLKPRPKGHGPDDANTRIMPFDIAGRFSRCFSDFLD